MGLGDFFLLLVFYILQFITVIVPCQCRVFAPKRVVCLVPSGFLDAVNAENQGGECSASRVHILVDRPLVDFFPLRYGRR